MGIINILAEKGDPEAWIQLIIFIIIGLVYGLSALFKSRFEGDEELEEEPEQSPARRNRQTMQRPRIPQTPRISRDKLKSSPEPEQEPEFKQTKPARNKPDKPKQPIGASIRKKKSDFFSDPDKPLLSPGTKGKIHRSGGGDKNTESPQESTSAFGIPDRTELQRAIVHYEIFGKPISIRQEDREDF